MKLGNMTDGIFLMHIVDALKETVEFTKDVGMAEFPQAIKNATAPAKKMITELCARRKSIMYPYDLVIISSSLEPTLKA